MQNKYFTGSRHFFDEHFYFITQAGLLQAKDL